MHGRHERGEARLIEDNSPYRVRGISGVGGRMLTIPGSEQKAREQGCSRYYGMSVVGRDERPRSSASAWSWEDSGNRGWLKPPTPEAGSLDVNHSRGSILARVFKETIQDPGRGALDIMGRKKMFSRKIARRQGKMKLKLFRSGRL